MIMNITENSDATLEESIAIGSPFNLNGFNLI